MKTRTNTRSNTGRTLIASGAIVAAAVTLTACTGTGVTGTDASTTSSTVVRSDSTTPSGEGTSRLAGSRAQGQPSPLTVPDKIQTRAAYKDGGSLYQSGDFKGAVEKLQVAALGRPEHAYTHYLLGLSLWKSGRTTEAEASLERASSLDSTSERTWLNLARVRLDMNDPQGALKATDSALKINERSAGALHQRGRALAELGRGDEALETLEHALDADPDNGYISNTIGYELIREGREADAVPFLEQARDRLPKIAYVRNNLGVAYERSGQIEKAVEEYRAAVDAGDSGGRAAASLARLDPVLTQMTADGRVRKTAEDSAVAKSVTDGETDGTPDVPKH